MDSPPSSRMEQEAMQLSSRLTQASRPMMMPTPFLCRQIKLAVSLDFSAAFFAALAEFSIVAAAVWPDFTEAAYCF